MLATVPFETRKLTLTLLDTKIFQDQTSNFPISFPENTSCYPNLTRYKNISVFQFLSLEKTFYTCGLLERTYRMNSESEYFFEPAFEPEELRLHHPGSGQLPGTSSHTPAEACTDNLVSQEGGGPSALVKSTNNSWG